MQKKNIVVKQNCHSRGMLSGIYNACCYHNKGKTLLNRCVEDPRLQPSGMTTLFNNGGFTLIELLVVVLIIGILAAVAVPQYKKAVIKSRAIESLIFLDSLIKAENIYYLKNGSYTFYLSNLDIDFSAYNPVINDGKVNNYIDCNTYWENCVVKINGKMKIQWTAPTATHSSVSDRGKRQCWGKGGTTESKICSSLGTYSHQNGEWYIYNL